MSIRLIDRYITGEVLKPFLLGTGLLVLIFAGYSTAVSLSDAANGLISPATVAKLTALSTITALEVLLPTAFYLSTLAALGRLYRDSEMAALHAAGIGEARVLLAVVKLAVMVSVVTGFLSLSARPWAYKQSYALRSEAEAAVQLQNIEPGTFVALAGTGYVLYAKDVDKDTGMLSKIFLRNRSNGRTEVISAKRAQIVLPGPERRGRIEFWEGFSYVLDNKARRDIQEQFGRMVIYLAEPETLVRYRRKAQPTLTLVDSPEIKDTAELQWRSSTPLATVLLAMLAVPLARSGPRQTRTTGMLFGLGIYTLFFGLATVARNLLEDGVVGRFPGIFWSYAALALLIAALLAWPRARLMALRT